MACRRTLLYDLSPIFIIFFDPFLKFLLTPNTSPIFRFSCDTYCLFLSVCGGPLSSSAVLSPPFFLLRGEFGRRRVLRQHCPCSPLWLIFLPCSKDFPPLRLHLRFPPFGFHPTVLLVPRGSCVPYRVLFIDLDFPRVFFSRVNFHFFFSPTLMFLTSTQFLGVPVIDLFPLFFFFPFVCLRNDGTWEELDL